MDAFITDLVFKMLWLAVLLILGRGLLRKNEKVREFVQKNSNLFLRYLSYFYAFCGAALLGMMVCNLWWHKFTLNNDQIMFGIVGGVLLLLPCILKAQTFRGLVLMCGLGVGMVILNGYWQMVLALLSLIFCANALKSFKSQLKGGELFRSIVYFLLPILTAWVLMRS